jgi:hypothetical protein
MKISGILGPFYGNVNDRILKLGSKLDYSNVSFTAILLALHSVFWPYRGIVHDARYYALQALNSAQNGQFAHDLFLEFGSQDNYSLFSLFMGSLVARVGLDIAFWLAYMVSTALFIYAAVRFLRSLIPDPSLANLGIIVLIAMPILYGGSGSFRILESFFTARLAAEGLSLLGMEAIYRKRPLRAIGFAIAGVAFHPIMGISSLLVIIGVLIKDRLRTRLAIGTAILLLLGALLLLTLYKWNSIGPLISPDALWFAQVKRRAFTCFPLEWRIVDWFRMIGSIAIILGCYRWLEPRARTLIGIIILTGIAGIISSVSGEYFSCPILIQGQGFRAFWQIQVLAMPLGLFTISRLSSGSSAFGSWVALGVYIFIGNPFFASSDRIYLALIAFQIGLFLCILALYLIKKIDPARGLNLSWLIGSLIIATGLALVVLGGIINNKGNNPMGIAYEVIHLGRRTFVFMFALWILWVFLSIIQTPKRAFVFSFSIWFSLSLIVFMVEQSSIYKEQLHPGSKDVRFIEDAIDKDIGKSGESLKDRQIYWPECPELVWFNLRSNSYYSYSQLAGVVFKKETIIEGTRRAMLAKPFEIAKLMETKNPLNRYEREKLSFLNGTIYEPAPTKEDLIRLANDRKLDWIILDIGFEGLYSATNKSVYIYDCSRIRHRNKVMD